MELFEKDDDKDGLFIGFDYKDDANGLHLMLVTILVISYITRPSTGGSSVTISIYYCSSGSFNFGKCSCSPRNSTLSESHSPNSTIYFFLEDEAVYFSKDMKQSLILSNSVYS